MSRSRYASTTRSVACLLLAACWTASTNAAQYQASRIDDPSYVQAEKLRNEARAESLKAAVPLYERALAALRGGTGRLAEADALTGLGRCHDLLGDKSAARQHYRDALAIYTTAHKPGSAAYVRNYIGLIDEQAGDRTKALEELTAALQLSRDAKDARAEGITHNNFGLVYLGLGDRRKAIDAYEQALPLHRQAGNVRGEATTLSNIGSALTQLGDPPKALEYLTRALPLREEIGEPRELGVTLVNIGAVHFNLGDFAQAKAYYQRGLEAVRRGGDRTTEAAVLHNIANVHEFSGEFQRALELYRQALPLQRSTGYKVGEANTLSNVGRLYFTLGEADRALEMETEALAVHRQVGNRKTESVSLVNLGNIHSSLGDRAKALARYAAALTIAQHTEDRATQAVALLSQGRLTVLPERAIDLEREALSIYRSLGNPRGEGNALTIMGATLAAAGRADEAVTSLARAREIAREIANPVGEAQALLQLARLERDRGDLPKAHEFAGTALALVESVRANVAGPELRSSFLASVYDYYETDIDVLMRLDEHTPGRGFAAQALQLSERARARSLLDGLAETRANIREGVDPALVAREQGIEQALNAKATRQARLTPARAAGPDGAQLAREIDALTAEYQAVRAEVRAASPRYAALTQPQPIAVADIQALLDRDTTLLEFAMGREHSYLWVVTRDSLASHRLAGREAIDAAARRFLTLASGTAPTADLQAATRELSALVLPPGANLAAKRLVVVGDGALQAIPFAALSTAGSKGALIADREIVSLPSASTLAMLRRDGAPRRTATRTLAVLADPVFRADDPRVARTAAGSTATTSDAGGLSRSATEAAAASNQTFPRLIGSRREATRILELVPPGSSHQAIDFDASRAAVTSPNLADARIVHFATHSIVDNVRPHLSGVVLSLVDSHGQPQDGFLRLHDIYNLKLSADLVVLSACQTALGKDVRGEGLVGLARGFMFAGTPRVVASLWKVDDRATTELMVRFYEGMVGPRRLSPSAALRAAQIALAAQPRWQSPYYWAAFVLQGEWK